MTRTITPRDYFDATGAPVYEMIVRYSVPAARVAGIALIKGQPVDAAYMPAPATGPLLDPPEEPAYPETPRNPDGSIQRQPPNCDGNAQYGQEATQSGQAADGGEYRAALQFESATGDLNPDACKTGVCATD